MYVSVAGSAMNEQHFQLRCYIASHASIEYTLLNKNASIAYAHVLLTANSCTLTHSGSHLPKYVHELLLCMLVRKTWMDAEPLFYFRIPRCALQLISSLCTASAIYATLCAIHSVVHIHDYR